MISEHPITMKIMTCANGETHEYVLLCGGHEIGRRVWLSGRPTPRLRAKAFREIVKATARDL